MYLADMHNEVDEEYEEEEQEEEPALNLGDLVTLKSGGPLMTVTSLETDEHGEDIFLCQWFDGRRYRGEQFYAECVDVQPPPTTDGI